MIYDIVTFFVDPIMWLIFSKEGSEWMPIILLALGALSSFFLISTLLSHRRK